MNDKSDERIIELFWSRSEDAIKETEKKYRGFCLSILANFLVFKEDREECLNDSLLELWHNIPPKRPESLSGYLAKILKSKAISRARAENAWKRGGRFVTVNEEFLADLTDGRTLADDYESAVAGRVLNDFLERLPEHQRKIFVLRYWYDEDILDIARRTGKGASSIKMLLKRLRDKLREELKKEGIIYE